MDGGDALELGRFYNRYGDIRYLVQTGETTYVVHGPSKYHRCSNDEGKGISMFDFEGGPTYYVGMAFPFPDSAQTISSLQPAKRGANTAVEIKVSSTRKPTKRKAKAKPEAGKIVNVKESREKG